MVCDIFVSYERSDNEVAEGAPFIDRLVKFITVEGRKHYGRPIDVFDEGALESGTQWQKATYDALADCRLFLPVVSPSWVSSKWAADQWEAMSKRVEKDGKTLVIPVTFELDKGSEAMLPDQIRSLTVKYKFQQLMDDVKFRNTAGSLVKEIASRLKALNPAPLALTTLPSAASQESPNKGRVFLGFAFSPKMREARDRIRGELHDRGYETREVEPNESWSANEVITEIEERAHKCTAAVHFLDENIGRSFSGDARTAVQIQCDLAKQWTAKCANLFWTGPVSDATLNGYPEFIHALPYNNDPIGAFSNTLLDRLRRPPVAPKPLLPPIEPVIWIICETGDRDVVQDIVGYFEEEKHWTAFVAGDDALETPYSTVCEQEHYFLFYWGQGGEKWCLLNYQQLVNARRVANGFRPPLAALVYCGQAKMDYKERFKWRFLKAREYDRFNPKAAEVEEFVSKVQSTVRGQAWPLQS
jgi:TIR domain